jgi:hypothetical protein
MRDRQYHQQEVLAFLQKRFSSHHWDLTLPKGSGNETYFANGNGHAYFVKLEAPEANYQAMASMGLTPPVIATGFWKMVNPSWFSLTSPAKRRPVKTIVFILSKLPRRSTKLITASK